MVVDSSNLLSKYLDEKEGNSLKFMQRMIYLIFAEVVYQRELLPREHFTEKHVFGCALHVPNTSIDRRQVALHNHLKGAAAAITDRKLKQCHLMVHKDRTDPSAADEVFIMDVVYADEEEGGEASMQMSCDGLREVRVRYGGVEELQKQTKNVFRCLRRGLSTLEPITRNVSFSFYIMYRDGVDRSYHPPGYGQAARMYALPDTAEIGDMGMLHAKEHACLLKVKSMMLEDGFQLMQRNVATQAAETQPDVPSQDGSSDLLSSDKASSLGVFDVHSDWDEMEKADQRSFDGRDQRSMEMGDQRSTGGRDQRSLTVASAKTARFEQSPTPALLDDSMLSEPSFESERSVELGTASADDFLTPVQSQGAVSMLAPAQSAAAAAGDTTADSDKIATFATTVSIVTKKLEAADKRREEEADEEEKKGEEEKEEEQEKEKSGSPISTPSDNSQSSSVDASSEASEKAASPARRVSLTKRRSLTKVPEPASSSDEPPTEASKEDAVPAPKAIASSGKDADSEPSVVDTVADKIVPERRRSARRRGSIEEKAATVPDEEPMEVDEEEEIAAPAAKKPKRGKKDTVTPQPKKESADTEKSSGRKGRSATRTAAKVDETPERQDEEEKSSGRKSRSATRAAAKSQAAEKPKGQEEEKKSSGRKSRSATRAAAKQQKIDETPKSKSESADTEKSSGRKGRSVTRAAAKAQKIEETPKRSGKRQEPAKEVRTPGEVGMKTRYSQDRRTVAESMM